MIGENVRIAWGPGTLFPAFPSESPSLMSRMATEDPLIQKAHDNSPVSLHR